MLNGMKKIAMGASVVAGVSLLGAPALAGSLTSVSTSGDVNIFESTGLGTVADLGNSDNDTALEALLSTGNVELDNDVDYGWNNATPSTLTAEFDDDTSILFGSLNQADWFGTGLAETWYGEAYSTYTTQFDTLALGYFLTTGSFVDASNAATMVGLLEGQNVFQRLSDPNIAYVEGDSGEFTFGLSGHNTLASGLGLEADDNLYGLFSTMMASEVVKYSLDGGSTWEYAYSFGLDSENSGVVDTGDGFSHTRIFNFTVGEKTPTDVPEPSAMLGLIALGGFLAAKKRQNA